MILQNHSEYRPTTPLRTSHIAPGSFIVKPKFKYLRWEITSAGKVNWVGRNDPADDWEYVEMPKGPPVIYATIIEPENPTVEYGVFDEPNDNHS